MKTPFSNRSRRYGGYTLIELLVVVAVLGILAAAVFPMAEITVQRDREYELKRALWEIRDAIDAYKNAVEKGDIALTATAAPYPASLETLVKGVPGVKDSSRMFFFLRRIPRDPFADPAVPIEKSWGLRSFQSSADRPQAGEDVYDVYSLSDKVGLNGVALKDW
jgi:general secretion pathway protein G